MSLQDVQDLIEMDRASPKRIAVVGDTMLDEWITARSIACQDGCPAVLLESTIRNTPGGAAGAARQMERWNSCASLIGPISTNMVRALINYAPRVDRERCCGCEKVPRKGRYVGEDGRVFFRADQEPDSYDLPREEMIEARDWAVRSIRAEQWDAVLLVDYQKGFLDDSLIRRIIEVCLEKKIPVVADPKRPPAVFEGAILKVNNEYENRHRAALTELDGDLVITNGAFRPFMGTTKRWYSLPLGQPVRCINHVGAGDCFGMHLALAIAHGMDLGKAAQVADAAARVYVQHPEGRPPWPHEICRQADPVRGKVVSDVRALRESLSGRVVFTNGVFRLPHGGHAWILDWSRRQGDVLVVGVNDDASARDLRPQEYITPLDERIEVLAGLKCVDWIVPFGEDTPEKVVEALKPDVLVKGSEYRGTKVPGDDLALEVRFAPESPFPDHCTHKIELIRGG